jgi:hypothetical protein
MGSIGGRRRYAPEDGRSGVETERLGYRSCSQAAAVRPAGLARTLLALAFAGGLPNWCPAHRSSSISARVRASRFGRDLARSVDRAHLLSVQTKGRVADIGMAEQP